MDKIISSITNILNIDDEILTKFLGYLHPMTVPKKTILIRPIITDENVYIIEKGIARSYIMIHCCPEKFYHSVSCLGPSPSGTLAVRSV